jgi:hypothetical protein
VPENRRAVTSMEESSGFVETTDQTYLEYNLQKQLKMKDKPQTVYTHTVSYINTGESVSREASVITQLVKKPSTDSFTGLSDTKTDQMNTSELGDKKVLTLEQELKRKLRLRDQKLKEFAARRHEERR